MRPAKWILQIFLSMSGAMHAHDCLLTAYCTGATGTTALLNEQNANCRGAGFLNGLISEHYVLNSASMGLGTDCLPKHCGFADNQSTLYV